MKCFCLLFFFQIATISSAFSQIHIDGITGPININQGEIKYWTANVTNEGNVPLIYEWDFGEGADSKVVRDNPHVSYTYKSVGDHTITLNVRLEEGHSAIEQINAHVDNLAPKIMYTDYFPLGDDMYQNGYRATPDSKNIRIAAIVYETDLIT